MLEIDEILKLENINDYVLSLNKSDRLNILCNDKIKDYYLDEKNINNFFSFIYALPYDEILFFFDSKVIDTIIHYYYFKDVIRFLKGDVVENIFNRIILQKEVGALKYLNEDSFLHLVEKEEIVNKIKILDRDNILLCLPIRVLNKLLIDPYFKSKLLKMCIEDIYYLTNNGLIIPSNLLQEEDLINKYIGVNEISSRRIYVNSLIENNFSLYEVINERLKRIYDENGFEELINEYNVITRKSDSMELKRKIMSLYSDKFLKVLIDRYFQDFYGNVLINIYNILTFNKNYNIISKENIEYYDLIINFSSFSIDEQKHIYNNMPKDIATLLYEDFRKCQDKAYSLINDEMIDASKLKSTKQSGITIYELNGEDFILPVHTIERKRDDYISWYKSAYKTLCLTLIGNESISTYRNPKEYLVVGFKKLNINNIMHVYHSDSFTDGEKSTSRINEIYSPHELLNKTKGYNEILILQNGYKGMALKPDYVVCYDVVTENDIMCAKNLGNIPIIKINTKNYKINNGYLDYEEKNYVKNINDLYNFEYKSDINDLCHNYKILK